MIVADGLVKRFAVHRRPPGVAAALRSLVHRSYDTVTAVDGISLRIERGERVGFLGPNGAGKTTTLKLLSGLLHPSEGSATVDGFTPHRRQPTFLRGITLVMGQKQQLIWDLPPADTFELNRAIYDVPTAQYRATLDELVALLGLAPLMGKPTRQLSLGERMKCELAAALLHRPTTLFLDEPTIGLDVAMQVGLREFVRTYNQRFQATVLLTSHYMDDVVALCPRVIVIDHGKLIHDGDLRALVRRIEPTKRVSFVLPASENVAARDADLAKLGALSHEEGGRTVLRIDEATLPAAISHLLSHHAIADLAIIDPPLEDIMRQLFAAAP